MNMLSKLKEKIKLPEWLKMVLTECLVFALGFYLASIRFIFGIYPFGIAFLCSTRKYTIFAFAGSALSSLFFLENPILHLIALISVLGLRVICSLIQKKDKDSSVILGTGGGAKPLDALFYENNTVRIVIACFVALGISLYNIITNGYGLYYIFESILFIIIMGTLTYSLLGISRGTHYRGFALSLCVLLFAMLYGISSFELWGLNFSIIISSALVLYTSKYKGTAPATALGALLGLTQGGTFSLVFPILGLVSGFIWKASPYLATMCSFAAAMGYSVLVGGYEGLVAFGPELLFSSLIMYSLLRFEILPVPAFLELQERGADAIISENKELHISERMKELSLSLYDTSLSLKELSKKAKAPTYEDISNLCLEIVEKHCYACPKHSICWEKDLSETEESLERLSRAAFTLGAVNKSDISEKFLHRCPNIELIFTEINEKTKEILTQGLKNDKLELIALDLELASKITESTIKKALDEQKTDVTKSLQLTRALEKIGFVASKIEVYGTRLTRVVAFNVDTIKTKCTKSDVKKTCEKVLGIKLFSPVFTSDDGITIMELHACSVIHAKCVSCIKPMVSEELCGDKLISFETEDSKFYLALCDGMGTGENARATATLCVDFLKKLLLSGMERALALSLLNSFVRARGGECSSSVDLLEIDLITGSGKLIKCGAAPTFIKRGEQVFKLSSKTMPIGIMKAVDGEELSFEIKTGDIVMLSSDGICPDEESSGYLLRLLKATKAPSLDTLGKEILAKREGTDDMTLALVEIS